MYFVERPRVSSYRLNAVIGLLSGAVDYAALTGVGKGFR